APNVQPPVARMGDFGKYRYELQQKTKDAKKKQRAVTWKEIRVSPKINEHDIDTKIRSAAKFLDEGDKLKVTVRFRGRELAHPDRGRVLLLAIGDKLEEHGTIERQPLRPDRRPLLDRHRRRPPPRRRSLVRLLHRARAVRPKYTCLFTLRGTEVGASRCPRSRATAARRSGSSSPGADAFGARRRTRATSTSTSRPRASAVMRGRRSWRRATSSWSASYCPASREGSAKRCHA